MTRRTTIPEVFDAFAAYHARPENMVWGSLHIVLEDNNHTDDSVEHCIEWARERGDGEGERLGRILLRMSQTQRGKLANLVHAYECSGEKPGWPTPLSSPD